MSSGKGTPANWKQILFEVLAMVKQLGVPTYFLTLSCADLRWDELPYIINKLNNLGLTEEELKNLSTKHEQNSLIVIQCSLLGTSIIKYKFFKEIILDGILGKTKYYGVEFQDRGSPNVHAFIWILNAPNIGNKTEYLVAIEKSVSANLPDPVEQLELFEHVKLYLIHSHSGTC